MLEILFNDSGFLKYYPNDTDFHYSYAINYGDFPIMHKHLDYWEFSIMTHGKFKNQIEGKGTEIYTENTLFFMTTEDCHACFKASPGTRHINIPIREKYLLKLLDAISPTLKDSLINGPRHFPISEQLVSEVENLIHQCNMVSPKQFDKKNGLLCSVVLLLLQELNRIYVNVQEYSSPFMKKLIPITYKQEFLQYTAQDLGDELNYSPAQLNRLFKQHLNTTPHEYLQKHKFRYARNLLENTNMGMLDIAMQIGYANLSHFFINFKKRYGITPGQYRKRTLEQ